MAEHPMVRLDPIPPKARPLQGLRAGVVSRCVAGGIDYAVITLWTLGCYFGVFILRFLLDPRQYTPPEIRPAWLIVAGFVFFVLYLWGAFATTGRTIGDRVMGLRVVDRKGGRLHWWWALLRAAFCAAFPIGLFWCAVSRENRSVQDVVLRSSVIHHWPTPAPAPDLADAARRQL